MANHVDLSSSLPNLSANDPRWFSTTTELLSQARAESRRASVLRGTPVGEAIHLYIVGVVQVSSFASFHHEYVVRVTVRGGFSWQISRRYSAFHILHRLLLRFHKRVYNLDFPPKKLVGNRAELFVQQRQRELQKWLDELANLGSTNESTQIALGELCSAFFVPNEVVEFDNLVALENEKLRGRTKNYATKRAQLRPPPNLRNIANLPNSDLVLSIITSVIGESSSVVGRSQFSQILKRLAERGIGGTATATPLVDRLYDVMINSYPGRAAAATAAAAPTNRGARASEMSPAPAMAVQDLFDILGKLCGSDPTEKFELSFRAFDTERRGLVSKPVFFRVLRRVYDTAMLRAESTAGAGVDVSTSIGGIDKEVGAMAEAMFESIDADRDGYLTFEEFTRWTWCCPMIDIASTTTATTQPVVSVALSFMPADDSNGDKSAI